MQVTTLFGLVLTVAGLALIQATPPTPPPTLPPTPPTPPVTRATPSPLVTIRPPWWPCRLPPVCGRRSPAVCGRNSLGNCQRFGNICQLLVQTRLGRNWQHVRDIECRNVRGGVKVTQCFQRCPRRPLRCGEKPGQRQLCLISNNNQACRLVANNCRLLNLNCHSRPQHNWRVTSADRCHDMRVGAKAAPCGPSPTPPTPRPSPVTTTTRKVPIIATIRPVTPRPSPVTPGPSPVTPGPSPVTPRPTPVTTA